MAHATAQPSSFMVQNGLSIADSITFFKQMTSDKLAPGLVLGPFWGAKYKQDKVMIMMVSKENKKYASGDSCKTLRPFKLKG